MDKPQLKLDVFGKGTFYINEGEHLLAEMVIGIEDHNLTVYHTEVIPEMEGKGLAKQLMGVMVDYARKNHLKVIPLCPYILVQFKRRPTDYKDIWSN